MTNVLIFDAYSSADIEQVHCLIWWGLLHAKPIIEKHKQLGILPDEEAITGYIAKGIEYHISMRTKRWCQNYDVHNEKPIPSHNPIGKKRKKIDLFIKFLYRKGNPIFVFEAKPLNYAKQGQRINNYINESGLQRFLSGEYSDFTANYREVGMLGYVLSNSDEYWYNKIKQEIDRKQDILRLIPPQRNTKIIDEFPYEWVSEHKRSSTERSILIYHILLDCSAL